MSVQRYRQHDHIALAESGVLQQHLALEWVRLNQDPSTGVVIARWAIGHPVLASARRPGDVVDAIDRGAPPRKDELLGALIELFQAGQQLAGRIALQAMLPKLAYYAFRTRLAARVEPRTEDRFQVVLCEFWEVLSRYPVQRRTARVAANLALDTLHGLARVTALPEHPLDPEMLARIGEPAGRPEAAELGPDLGSDGVSAVRGLNEGPDPDGDLEALLAWGVARGVVTDDEATLLRSVYAGGSDGVARGVSAGYRDHAKSTGLPPATLRQRASRARRRLATAVAEERELGA